MEVRFDFYLRFLVSILLFTPSAEIWSQFHSGVILDKVICLAEPEESYALYLPNSYREDVLWPVIYFFDCEGRGTLPVRKYKEIADEFGLILVCSNNSRNGRLDANFRSADAVFNDSQHRLRIDPNRIFTSGLSGGSRLALTLSLNQLYNVKGVIGMGAGESALPKYQLNKKYPIKYVGLVGNRDLNYLEQKELSLKLDELDIENILIISSLDHVWASKEDFRLSWLWITGVSSETLQSIYLNKISVAADSISRLDQELMLNDLGIDPKGFLPAINNKTRADLTKAENRNRFLEVRLRSNIKDSLNTIYENGTRNNQKVEWIMSTITTYKKNTKSRNLNLNHLIYYRVLDWVREATKASALQKIDTGKYMEALTLFEIHELTTGNKPFCELWYARIHALSGNNKSALFHISRLLEFRTTDFASIDSDPYFQSLKELPGYQKIKSKAQD